MSDQESIHGESNPSPDPIPALEPLQPEEAPPVPPVERRAFGLRHGRGLAVAALTAAAVVTAGVFASGLAFGSHHVALGAGRTSATAPCPPPQAPSAEQLKQAQQQFAQQLAQALGKPEAEVEQALTAFQADLPKPLPGGPQAGVMGPDPATLAPIAAKLGVTAQALAAAMTAAAPQLPACPPAGVSGQVKVKVDAAQMFAQVAQQLGNGITGEQVQAAFQSSGPITVSASRTQSGAAVGFAPGGLNDPLAKLAAALNVTPEQLKAALQTIAGSSGCPLPPAPAAGNGPAGSQPNNGFFVSSGGAAAGDGDVAIAAGGSAGPILCVVPNG